MFEVDYKDLEQLNQDQLVTLLRKLLSLHVRERNISTAKFEVQEKNNVSDGGIDGYITIDDNINSLPMNNESGKIGFQVKAGSCPPGKCYEEVLDRHKVYLKPGILKLVEEEGTYILFNNKELNKHHKEQREKRFRDAIQEGVKNICIHRKYSNEEASSIAEQYSKVIKISIYGTIEIAKWTNKYIDAVTFVWECGKKTVPLGIMTCDMWGKNKKFDNNKFIENGQLKGYKEKLRGCLSTSKKVARIIGSTGLGKSRFAYETFRESNLNNTGSYQEGANRSLVYFDTENSSYTNEIQIHLNLWIENGLTGLLIVDNCDVDLHEKLKRSVELAKSNFSLLTIGYQKASEDDYIFTRLEDDHIREIIRSKPRLSKESIAKIVKISEGFPGFAIRLYNMQLQGSNILELNGSPLINKLLWSNIDRNNKAYEVILACSLFSYIGVKDELESQYEFIAKNICEIEPNEFYKLIRRYFFGNEIMGFAGRYLIIKIEFLARSLAATWWNECHPSRAEKILRLILKKELKTAFLQRLSELSDCRDIQIFVTNLCKKDGLLSNLEGSHAELIMYLVDINADSVMEVLERALEQNEINGIRAKFGDDFKYIISTLKKLCLKETTSVKAVRILNSLATEKDFFIEWFQRSIEKSDMSLDQKLSILIELARTTDLCRLAKQIILQFLYEPIEVIVFQKIIATINVIANSNETYWPEALIEIKFWSCKYPGLISDELEKFVQPKENSLDELSWYANYFCKIISKLQMDDSLKWRDKISGLEQELHKYTTKYTNNLITSLDMQVLFTAKKFDGSYFGRSLAYSMNNDCISSNARL